MTANTAGYTLHVVNGNTWRIYHDKNPKHLKEGEGMIHQYYFNEKSSSVRKLAPGQGIQKSFPHHHCLMKASLSSTQTLLRDKCLHRSYARTAYAFQPECIISSTDALARIHAVEETPFTELTARQKKYLMAQSAMAGILVSRLFGFSSAKPHTIKWLKKHADITAKYIHSALACEYLIGNRYYYNLPTVLSQEKSNVGRLPIEKILCNIKAEDATYDKIKENRAQLVKLYNSNIERLEDAVKQFRRGFLSIQTIRKDSEYKKMLEMFWMLQTQCMKYKTVLESSMSARQTFCERNNVTFDRRAIQVMVCNLIFSCQVICPRLFAYEIVHLFDDCSGVYAKYVEVTKAKHLEMCNEGLTSAFLTFSAIEPNMVSTVLAPYMREVGNAVHYPSDFSEHAYHIPSRDAIFGQLLSKHRVHIPRPVNIARTFFTTRNNKDCFYLPLQEALTELHTGKKVAKQVWKKNKQNFTRKY
jgi:hypothetical protein